MLKTNQSISKDGESYCYMTTENMKKLVEKSNEKGFNRTIPLDIVNNFTNEFCLIFVTMTHEHIAGVQVEPHYRICFYASQNKLNSPQMYIVDTDIDVFEEYAEYKKS